MAISCCLDREMVEKLFQCSQMLSPEGIKVAEVRIRVEGQVVHPRAESVKIKCP